MGFGGEILNYIGGTTRFLYNFLLTKSGLSKDKLYRFNEYLYGAEDAEDFVWDELGHTFVNRIIGFITLVSFFLLSFKIETLLKYYF